MNPLTSNEIITYLNQNKKVLYDRFGGIRIGVFGGYARGAGSSSSDIDMVVEMEGSKKNIHNFWALNVFWKMNSGKKWILDLNIA